jgi:hypothetical protein
MAQMVRTELREDNASRRYTAYVLRVSYNNERWQISRRYSEFLQLHQLRVLEKCSEVDLPPFPPKRLLSSLFGFDPDDESVNERRAMLQNYLNVLLSDPKFLAVRPALGKFLQPTAADKRERVNESSRSLVFDTAHDATDGADDSASGSSRPSSASSSSSSLLLLPAPPQQLVIPRVFRVKRSASSTAGAAAAASSSSASSSSTSSHSAALNHGSSGSLRLIDTEVLHPDWLIAQLNSTLGYVASVQNELAAVRGPEAKLTVLEREEARLNGAENNLLEQRASFQAMLDERSLAESGDERLMEYLLVCCQHVDMAMQWRAEALKAALASLGRGEKDDAVVKVVKRFELRCDELLIACFTAPAPDLDPTMAAAPSAHRSSTLTDQAKQLVADANAELVHVRDLFSLGQVTQTVFNDVRERIEKVAGHAEQLCLMLSGGSIATASMFADARLSSFEQQLFQLLADVDVGADANSDANANHHSSSSSNEDDKRAELQARIDELAKDLAHYRRMLAKERSNLQTELYHETLRLREQSADTDEARRAADAMCESIVLSRKQADDRIDRRIEDCMENVEELRYLFNKRFGLGANAGNFVAATADRARQGEVVRTHVQRQDSLYAL